MDRDYANIVTMINEYGEKRKKQGKSVFLEDLSLKLRLYRAKVSFSHEQVARALGVKRMQVWRWEHGKSKPNKSVLKIMKEIGII